LLEHPWLFSDLYFNIGRAAPLNFQETYLFFISLETMYE
jgi:hypothetical protein